MSVLKIDVKKYPLTKKWFPLVRGFSSRYNISETECIQEAYIIEWQLRKKNFKTPAHQENYFKLVLYRRLRRLVRNTTSVLSNCKSHLISFSYISSYRDFKLSAPRTEENFDNMVDSIIQLRPFNEIYYEELVAHVVVVLSEIDLLASRLFIDRMNLQLKWKELRLQQYKSLSHNKFYQSVKLIKQVVKREVCYGNYTGTRISSY